MERTFYFSIENKRLDMVETSPDAAYQAGGASTLCWFLQYLYNLAR